MKPSVKLLFSLGLGLITALPAQAQTAQVALSRQVAQSRFAVLIPEVILRRPVPDPAAETEITRALLAAGYRVVDLSTQQRNTERDLLRTRAGYLADLQSRLNADYLITGEAFAEEYGAVAGGLRAYTARLEVKVVDLASSQVVYSNAFQGSGVGATDAVAGKTALMNVGRQAGKQLPTLLNQALDSKAVTAQHVYRVRIAAPATFSKVNGLVKQLKAAGIKDIMIRSVDSAGALIEVSAEQDITAVADMLESQHLTVTGMTGQEISTKF